MIEDSIKLNLARYEDDIVNIWEQIHTHFTPSDVDKHREHFDTKQYYLNMEGVLSEYLCI